MPNLNNIFSLKEKYGVLNFQEKLANDAVNKQIVDALSKKAGVKAPNVNLLEHFDLSTKAPDIIQYFELNQTTHVVLLFIDIANFSKYTLGKSNQFISDFLNDYYEEVIPIIYKYKGEIEKLMGDGIICVFGKPFFNGSLNECLSKAELCSKEIIKTLETTAKEVKIAIHDGNVSYYKTPTELYKEYTMIGQTLTELYRLESVSKNNSINYYKNSAYDTFRMNRYKSLSDKLKTDFKTKKFTVELPGVDKTELKFANFK